MNHAVVVHSSRSASAAGLALLFLASCHGGNDSAGQPLFAHAPGSPIAVAGGNIVIGDMNKDGNPDLILATGLSVAVLLGKGDRNGDGQFHGTPASTVSVSASPGEMVLGDVNGDGSLDLAIATHDSYGVIMLLGDGKGALAVAPNSPIVMKDGQHPHTHGLAMSDLNNDGKLDLVSVNNADNDVSVVFGDGRGGFTLAPGSPFAVGPSPYPLALGDVDGNGSLDIVATATATGPARAQQLPFSRALTLLLADGRGGFRSSQLPLRTGQPWFVAIDDVNGDGKRDLVATHHEQSALTVLLGDGRSGFKEADGSPFDFGRNAFHVALVDTNRDARPDVLAATGDGVRVMLGDGRGGFTPAPHSPFQTGQGTWSLAVGDVNRDGRPDVVAGNESTVSVLLGQ